MKKNQSETSQSGITLIRGAFFDFLDDPWKYIGREHESARYIRDGLLVVEGGLIKDFGAFDELSPKYPDQPVTHIQNRIIMPGFIDGHIHFPQVRVLGAYGKQLLDWLQIWIFPEEIKYANRDYAREAAKHFFDDLLAGGTTTCQAFTTSSPVSTEVFFAEAEGRGMRTIAGLTGIDRFAPPDYVITPEDFYRESKRLIETYHRRGRHLYAISGSTRTFQKTQRKFGRQNKSFRTARTIPLFTKSTDCSDRNSQPVTAYGYRTMSSGGLRKPERASASARCRIFSSEADCSASVELSIPITVFAYHSAATWAEGMHSASSACWRKHIRLECATTRCWMVR